MRFRLRKGIIGLLVVSFCVLSMPKTSRICANAQVYTSSKSECVMELHSRRILYASNADKRLPMASTTKILTAITVLESCDNLQEQIEIPDAAIGVEGSSVYLKKGDVYSIEDLLYGLMLRSGNDCATALALRFGGSIGNFAAKMNETAQKAGAIESNFKNPHGLPCDGHYITARDLSLITCYAMENPTFKTIVSTSYYEQRHWKNKNKMLEKFDGANGVKTGYTKAAGRCLVSSAEREGMTLICSVLNSPNMYERSMQLLKDAFAAYQYTQLVKNGQVMEHGVAQEDFYYPLLKEEQALIKVQSKPLKKPTMYEKKQKIVGQFEIYLANQLLFSGNLYKL